MFGDPVVNEKGWEIVNLSDIAEIKIGPFGSLLHKEDYVYGEHALVNPSHIIENKIVVDLKLTITDSKYEELKPYQLKRNDVVLGRRGEMGRCAIVEEDGLLCGTGSIIIRPNEKMKPYFLQKVITNPAYKRIIEDKAVGSTMPNLNVPIVSSLPIPLFPVEEQKNYISFIKTVESSKTKIKELQSRIEYLKASYMQEFFI